MDLLSLVLSCSISTTIDDRIIASIIEEQSFGNTFYVRSEGHPYGVGYESQKAAISAVKRLKEEGKGIYIGLMGIPYSAENNVLSHTNSLFKDCNNIAFGTEIIDVLSDQCKAEGRRDLVTCSLKKYAQKTDRQPVQFVEKVIHKSAQNEKYKAGKTLKNAQIFIDIDKDSDSGNGVFLNYDH